jgi:nickel/cobalt exporter
MTDITQIIQSGSAHAWLYIPVAILLGALHGLEPGHSKTMMAAFIIAIRGTVWQAVLLGLSAAISHSLLIWILAALALHYGGQWNAEHTEPYFHLASAAMIFALAVWMYLRTRREVAEAHAHDHRDGHDHDHTHEQPAKVETSEPDQWQAHSHSHTAAPRLLTGETMTASGLILPAGMAAPSAAPARSAKQGPHGGMLLDTGHGWLEVCIFETGVPPRFRIYPCKASGETVPLPKGTQLGIETARLDGRTQKFAFEAKDTFWEATTPTPIVCASLRSTTATAMPPSLSKNPKTTAWNTKTRTNALTRRTSPSVSPTAPSPRRRSSCSASLAASCLVPQPSPFWSCVFKSKKSCSDSPSSPPSASALP